jgi:mannitol-1-phosphate/altronate dehydrogenase
MAEHIFTGFGFGPIQSGLFVKEAFESGNFARIVVAEIDQDLVDAVRANNGSYYVNVACADEIKVLRIDNVELMNPSVDDDRKILLEVLAQSTEIVTSLPSVNFYDAGGSASVASLIAEGIKANSDESTIVYTAENNNHAAEAMQEVVTEKTGPLPPNRAQFLNTVIGKMSQIVTDSALISELNLKPIAPNLEKAFLVEEFNRILVDRTTIPDFTPGIEVFAEKDDLLPFEHVKLFSHNAMHTLFGFLGAVKGLTSMTELQNDPAIMAIGREAFMDECGQALIKKYAHLNDTLFTQAGFKDYAEDLLIRIVNPFLKDTIARAYRDVVRKLGLNDRIVGTMTLALEQGVEPTNMALGAMGGIAVLLTDPAEGKDLPDELRYDDWRKLNDAEIKKILLWIWNDETGKYTEQLIKNIQTAHKRLITFING